MFNDGYRIVYRKIHTPNYIVESDYILDEENEWRRLETPINPKVYFIFR